MKATFASRPVLMAETAYDLMTPNPLSVSAHATIREALTMLVDKGISAAPVINSAGRPVGVLSRADILRYDREHVSLAVESPEFYDKGDLRLRSGDNISDWFQVESVDRTEVREIMTPVVFSVAPETSATETIDQMLLHHVHRLFVVDSTGTLVGVVSSMDVLRRIGRE